MVRCPACSAQSVEGGRYCSECGALLRDRTSAATETSAEGASAVVSHASVDRARFIPGTVLSKRYRIVSLLGRGGMGEVYRADDLKLGQPVALKFLTEPVARDEARLARFLNEVKVALKVTHPNVCRVYDVGEVGPSTGSGQGQHYIAMEYVDGEDLASLLRRIGRLPKDKAVQIARQLCAGLSAAHEEGILHRDLKPANVMIDGRGRAKITDFGLASLAGAVRGEEVRAGTPLYMAPEQLAGREVTVRSDVYSLGLVLYELFTGKRAFAARTPDELARQQEESQPASPSSHVEGMDPAVERAILRCLERDATNRPSSALAVAASLPGSDPLAAALAAGETPSPEMVAAAGPRGGLRRPVALCFLLASLAAILVCAFLAPHQALYSRVPIEKSIPALTENAREIVRMLGYTDPHTNSVSYLSIDGSLLDHLRGRDGTAARWSSLSDPSVSALTLFYRQSPRPLVPRSPSSKVEYDDPPRREGDIYVWVNLQGRLVRFEAIPPVFRRDTASPSPPDWQILFKAAGLDMNEFESTTPTIQRVHSDARAAWSGTLGTLDMPIRVEAAVSGGKPVYFEIIFPSDSYWAAKDDEKEGNEVRPPVMLAKALGWVLAGLMAAVVITAVFLCMRNLRLGRGDRRAALRLALVLVALHLLKWILGGHHVPGLEEFVLFLMALATALLIGAVGWMLYMALEPAVRHFWPQVLVSWSRLVAGNLSDPLVGRDLLAGLALGLAMRIIYYTEWRAPEWLGLPAQFVGWFGLEAMRGARWALATPIQLLIQTLPVQLSYLLLLVLLRVLLRKPWLAASAFCLIITLQVAREFAAFGESAMLWPIGLGFGLAQALLVLLIAFRYGLVGMLASGLAVQWFKYFPTTMDVGAPYFATSLFGLASAAGLVVLSYFICVGGRAGLGEGIPGRLGGHAGGSP